MLELPRDGHWPLGLVAYVASRAEEVERPLARVQPCKEEDVAASARVLLIPTAGVGVLVGPEAVLTLFICRYYKASRKIAGFR